MYGPGATQRVEGRLILASLEQGEPKIQFNVGKVGIGFTDGLEFFSGVREALLAKSGERTIIVFASRLRCRAVRRGRNEEKCR